MSVSSHDCRVVVLVACYNNQADLDDCFASLIASQESGVTVRFLMVDDGSTDQSIEQMQTCFPEVERLALSTNRGYAAANNAGYDYVRRTYPDTDYLVLLNADTAVASGWLRTLVAFMAQHPDAGAVQPKIVLFDQSDTINTVGGQSHYLGFGMMTGYGEKDQGQFNTPRTINFPSGCAVMLRMDLLEKFGLFDKSFYMYLEDADLGWKLTQAGHPCWYCPDAVIRHKYISDAPRKAYEHLERNRWMLLLTYYQWKTLFILLPALLAMECGQMLFALSTGKLPKKCCAIASLFRKKNRLTISERRVEARKHRTINDVLWIQHFKGEVALPTAMPLLLRVANPILRAYFYVALWIMRRCSSK